MASANPINPLDRIVGARARILRLKRRLSLAEAARLCGATEEEVEAMEEGRRRIGARMMFDLCDLYDTAPHCFYSGTQDQAGGRADARVFLRLLSGSKLRK